MRNYRIMNEQPIRLIRQFLPILDEEWQRTTGTTAEAPSLVGSNILLDLGIDYEAVSVTV